MTPDYYSALRKAAAAPGLSERAARHAFYERARRALENDLRNTDPPLREADIDAHIDALGAAIVRIERELDAPPRPLPRDVEAVPADEAAAPPRRRVGMALGALALIAIAGLGAYLMVPRERSHPAPAARSEAPRTSNEPAAEEAQAPYILRQQRVYYRTTHPAGTVIVSRNQRFLYIVQPNQVAIRYAIGVGPECETLSGLFRITGKAGEPDQRPTAAGGAAPGPDAGRKPGAQFALPALYFGGTHAVHRTSEPGRIGQAARLGCFHAWEKDIADLYERVPLEERVVIAN